LTELRKIANIRIMKKEKQYTSDGIKILHDLFVRDDQKMLSLLKKEREKADIAQKIYDMRIGEGLTQKQLADRIGTTPSVISRLEDSDYDGHSLKMLQKIARALNYQLDIQFKKQNQTSGQYEVKYRCATEKDSQ